MTTCSVLIRRSNDLYQLMLQLLNTLSESPEAASPQELQARHHRFCELQESIEVSELQLHEALSTTVDRDGTTETLLRERQHLIQQVLERNKTVSLQAQAIRSLIGDEIRKSGNGYAALKGYRTTNQHQSGGSFKKAM